MTVRQASLAELVDVAAAAGFGRVTTTVQLFEAAAVPASELRRRLSLNGLTVAAIDGLLLASPTATEHPTALEVACYVAAEELEAPIVNLVYVGAPPPVMDDLAEATGALCRRAKSHGLGVALEFVPESGVRSLAEAVVLVRRVGADNLGIVLDTWHHARSGGTLEEVASALSHLAGVQLADRRFAQDQEPYVPMSGRYLPGEGELPLQPLVELLLDQRPALAIGIEVINDELRALPASEAAGRAFASLSRLLSSARPG